MAKFPDFSAWCRIQEALALQVPALQKAGAAPLVAMPASQLLELYTTLILLRNRSHRQLGGEHSRETSCVVLGLRQRHLLLHVRHCTKPPVSVASTFTFCCCLSFGTCSLLTDRPSVSLQSDAHQPRCKRQLQRVRAKEGLGRWQWQEARRRGRERHRPKNIRHERPWWRRQLSPKGGLLRLRVGGHLQHTADCGGGSSLIANQAFVEMCNCRADGLGTFASRSAQFASRMPTAFAGHASPSCATHQIAPASLCLAMLCVCHIVVCCVCLLWCVMATLYITFAVLASAQCRDICNIKPSNLHTQNAYPNSLYW